MTLRNILTLVLILGIIGVFAQVDRSKLPEPTTPRPVSIGEYESFELKNGLKVFIIENHKLPQVTYNIDLDFTPILEKDKVGYLSMVGQMMKRGTETKTKEQIDEEIDFIGASLSTGSNGVFASGLSKYSEKVLELMTDVIFNPTFPEEELEKIRKQTISSLAADKENPNAIASNLNSVLVYGKNHPYGEVQTEETTNNILVDDLKVYHQKYFRPNIAYLAIVGDVNPEEIKKMVKKYFGSWKRGDIETLNYDMPKTPEKTMVGIVNRSSAVQSNINITYPVDLKIGSEDQIKTRVMNQILGGSGSAKLFMNLREDKAYTYGSYSSISADKLVGRFNANAEVRNEVTDSSIVQIFYEIGQVKNGNITEDEMNLAKNSISGRFSRSLEQPQTVARFALNTAQYNLPDDYYSTYLQKVQAVTKEDVQAMAKKYLTPENAYINVVGKANEIAEGLKQFGELTYYDTYGNEVNPSMTKLPEGLTSDKVLKNYIKAIGGKEKLDRLKTITTKMEASAMGQNLSIKAVNSSPSKSFLEITMGGNVIEKQVFDGKKGMISGMQGNMAIEGDEAKDMVISSAIIEELAYLSEATVQTKLVSVEKIDGKDSYAIEITMPSGNKSTRYYDTESGLLVRFSTTEETPQGPITLSTDFGEYKEFDGVLFPTKIKQPMDEQLKMNIKVTEILINQEVSEDTFMIK